VSMMLLLLKKADIGIAVEGATEAAKAAADIVFVNSWTFSYYHCNYSKS